MSHETVLMSRLIAVGMQTLIDVPLYIQITLFYINWRNENEPKIICNAPTRFEADRKLTIETDTGRAIFLVPATRSGRLTLNPEIDWCPDMTGFLLQLREKLNMSKSIKSCFVTTCKNTSRNSEKIFITVPFNDELRKVWCRAVNRNKIPKGTSGSFYCCEDHFDLENDCENWIAYKLMQQKNLDGEHVPRDVSQLSNSAKKRKMENIKLISEKCVKKLCFEEPSTSKQNMPSPQSLPEKRQIPSTSKQIPSPQNSPEKRQVMQSSSSSSVGSSLPSNFQIEDTDSSDEQMKNINLQTMSLQRTLLVIESFQKYIDRFKKIRLNDSFYRMALDFGVTTSVISRIFTKDLTILAAYFKNLIYWPEAHLIKENLPIPFRARYWNVHATPHGIINFVSEGYGGRITDTQIVQESGYLNVLPRNCDVMADRGFKNIDSMLVPLNCKLIRPPSTSSGVKGTKEEVKLSKRIASLRIHIERVIRRLREFEMLNAEILSQSTLIAKLCLVQ
ncbi:hypothetical protein NQ315_008791 [Exocentrus adspersus]|uniref:THAP-type domain-containing protein n=1 Tax=Exocentrus adspersus TaxID=1586481 RepID=A0AAV8VGT0_9CUCU|nr:hypothetical protein NQ315_008791 [Exocentrus adspersus]